MKFTKTVRRFAPVLAAAGGIALLAGCGSSEAYVVTAPSQAESPVVAAVQPASAQDGTTGAATPSAASTVIVPHAPPSPRQEAKQARPSSAHVWVKGYWAWRNNRYEWMAGHWEVPPRTDAVWIAPRWAPVGDGSYRFTDGYWG